MSRTIAVVAHSKKTLGDGTVQLCIDALAGSDAKVATLPAGTADLLATNLGIPHDMSRAVEIGLHGQRMALDTGTVNGEHFSVTAGAGLDALMINDADAGLKDGFGRAAYLWTGARNLAASPVRAQVDGGARKPTKRLRIKTRPKSITACVPEPKDLDEDQNA